MGSFFWLFSLSTTILSSFMLLKYQRFSLSYCLIVFWRLGATLVYPLPCWCICGLFPDFGYYINKVSMNICIQILKKTLLRENICKSSTCWRNWMLSIYINNSQNSIIKTRYINKNNGQNILTRTSSKKI